MHWTDNTKFQVLSYKLQIYAHIIAYFTYKFKKKY